MDLTRIGPYLLERELGSGGMGTVYLARQAETGRTVAVKILPAALSREPGFVARFTREIDALRTVTSPHIVELYDSGVDAETYYYAMEYVDGETLTARLERVNRLPWRDVIDIAVQVCRALKAAHIAGVIHRDLKPSNLLLTPDGQVKLTDFGVAQVFAGGKLTATGGVVGTAEFMSPEQAEGKRATKQSDIYALGAVMYVMLTGRPPFTGKSALDIAQKHRFGQFDSPRRFVAEIPTWLDEVVCKCLAKNADHRYPDAYVLSLRLAEIPRKVDFSTGLDSSPADAGESVAETQAAAAIDAGPAPAAGQIGGTFVRDVMRAELDRVGNRTRLESWLDSTWILVLLLVVVISGGVWLYDRQSQNAERLFAAGEQLMQSTHRNDWVTASRDCFAPLLAADAVAWEPRVAPYRRQIALAELEQEIVRRLRSRGNGGAQESESMRQLQRVHRDIEAGDLAAARVRLLALQSVLPLDDDHAAERQVVVQLLESLPMSPPPEENALAAAAFAQAEKCIESGDVGGARRIWAGLQALYRGDPTTEAIVRKADERMRELAETPSP